MAPRRLPQTSVTVRKLAPEVKQKLRLRAARHGRSLEAEMREILRAAAEAATGDTEADVLDRMHARFASLGGVKLRLPRRETGREPPDFSREP